MSKSHADYLKAKHADYVATHARRRADHPTTTSTGDITPKRTRGGQIDLFTAKRIERGDVDVD